MGKEINVQNITMSTWLFRLAYSFDQFLNAFLYPLLNMTLSDGSYLFGEPDETLSSVMGKNVRMGKCKGCYFICLILHKLDKTHCEKSTEEDEHSGYKE